MSIEMRDVKDAFDQFKAAHEKARAEGTTQLDNIRSRVLDLEQRNAPGMLVGGQASKDLASVIAADSGFQSFRERRTKDVGIQVNSHDLLRVQANTITQSGNDLSQNYRLPGIVAEPLRLRFVRQILPMIPCTGSGIEYSKESTYTNNAAPQYAAGSPAITEGATKAQSDVTFSLVNAPIPTIAHWLKASRQSLDDQPALASWLNNRLRLGLEIALENQILNGSGSSGNMTGLTISATAFTPSTGDTGLDSISRAAATLLDNGFLPNAIVMNATDFGAIERTKSTTDEYILGDPASATGASLWGIPVFRSASMASGKFLIGDFLASTALFMRQDAIVQMTESNDTDFVKNLVTVRAELRAVIAALVPGGLRYGNLTL